MCPTHVLWRHGREPCTGRECFRCRSHYGRPPQLWRSTGMLERARSMTWTRSSRSASSVATSIASSDSRATWRCCRRSCSTRMRKRSTTCGQPTSAAVFLLRRPARAHQGARRRRAGVPQADAPADLLIAGAGSHERRSERLPVNRPASDFSATRPERLAPLYRHAVAHIAPSVCFETFGNTLVEVVPPAHPGRRATTLGHSPRSSRHAGAGELFDNARASDVSLDRFASDRAYRDRLGAAGRCAYEATWSEEAIVPRYLDIVERTIARRFPTTPAAPAVAVT